MSTDDDRQDDVLETTMTSLSWLNSRRNVASEPLTTSSQSEANAEASKTDTIKPVMGVATRSKLVQLDTHLHAWYLEQTKEHDTADFLTRQFIENKAKELAAEFGLGTDFSYISTEWLQEFFDRYKIATLAFGGTSPSIWPASKSTRGSNSGNDGNVSWPTLGVTNLARCAMLSDTFDSVWLPLDCNGTGKEQPNYDDLPADQWLRQAWPKLIEGFMDDMIYYVTDTVMSMPPDCPFPLDELYRILADRAAQDAVMNAVHTEARIAVDTTAKASDKAMASAMVDSLAELAINNPDKDEDLLELRVVTCTNLVGTERWPLVVLGKEGRPPGEFPTRYVQEEDALLSMSPLWSDIVMEWEDRLRTVQGRMLLLMDHKWSEEAIELRNMSYLTRIQIVVLPKFNDIQGELDEEQPDALQMGEGCSTDSTELYSDDDGDDDNDWSSECPWTLKPSTLVELLNRRFRMIVSCEIFNRFQSMPRNINNVLRNQLARLNTESVSKDQVLEIVANTTGAFEMNDDSLVTLAVLSLTQAWRFCCISQEDIIRSFKVSGIWSLARNSTRRKYQDLGVDISDVEILPSYDTRMMIDFMLRG